MTVNPELTIGANQGWGNNLSKPNQLAGEVCHESGRGIRVFLPLIGITAICALSINKVGGISVGEAHAQALNDGRVPITGQLPLSDKEPTRTPTPTRTPSPTASATPTETPTDTSTPTQTATAIPSYTPTSTETPTSTSTPTQTATATPSPTPTSTTTSVPDIRIYLPITARNFEPPCKLEIEPNDNPTTATDIVLGEEVCGALDFSNEFYDFFTTAWAGGSFTVTGWTERGEDLIAIYGDDLYTLKYYHFPGGNFSVPVNMAGRRDNRLYFLVYNYAPDRPGPGQYKLVVNQ